MALNEAQGQWLTYNDISESTGIAVSTLHGSAVPTLLSCGAVDKLSHDVCTRQIQVKITKLGEQFVCSLYTGGQTNG